MENVPDLPFLDSSSGWVTHCVTSGKSCSPLSFEFPIPTVGNWLGGPALLLPQAPQRQLSTTHHPKLLFFWVSCHCEWQHHHLVYLAVTLDAPPPALPVVSPQVLCMPVHFMSFCPLLHIHPTGNH